MSDFLGSDLDLSVARSSAIDPGLILRVLFDRPELLDRGFRVLIRDLRPPRTTPIAALGVDGDGRLVVLEWCGNGGDSAALGVLDHLEWLADNLSFLTSLGIAAEVSNPAREWRVFVLLSETAPSLARRLRWVSEVSFEFFIARCVRVDDEPSLWIEPWTTWMYEEPRRRKSGRAEEDVQSPTSIPAPEPIETLSDDAFLSREERAAISASLRRTRES